MVPPTLSWKINPPVQAPADVKPKMLTLSYSIRLNGKSRLDKDMMSAYGGLSKGHPRARVVAASLKIAVLRVRVRNVRVTRAADTLTLHHGATHSAS